MHFYRPLRCRQAADYLHYLHLDVSGLPLVNYHTQFKLKMKLSPDSDYTSRANILNIMDLEGG
jgi:hypothetical protein